MRMINLLTPAAFALAAANLLAQSPQGHEQSSNRQQLAETTFQNSGDLQQPPSANRVLVLSPKASTRNAETHAAIALSNTVFSGDITFRGRVRTVKQLRTGSDPNPWESVWIVWNYNGGHFYYVALKTNGWEIGKHDRTIANQQRFLKTGTSEFPVGTWHEFEIIQRQSEIQVHLDRAEVATFEDSADPYTSGKVGFYTEDAEIQIGDISAPFKDDFSDYPLRVFRGDGQIVKNWSMPFLGHGYAAIAMAKR